MENTYLSLHHEISLISHLSHETKHVNTVFLANPLKHNIQGNKRSRSTNTRTENKEKKKGDLSIQLTLTDLPKDLFSYELAKIRDKIHQMIVENTALVKFPIHIRSLRNNSVAKMFHEERTTWL